MDLPKEIQAISLSYTVYWTERKFLGYNEFYFVPNKDVFENPKKLNGEFKESYKRFISDTRLKLLPNGFVIFTDELFVPLKKEIDDSN